MLRVNITLLRRLKDGERGKGRRGGGFASASGFPSGGRGSATWDWRGFLDLPKGKNDERVTPKTPVMHGEL